MTLAYSGANLGQSSFVFSTLFICPVVQMENSTSIFTGIKLCFYVLNDGYHLIDPDQVIDLVEIVHEVVEPCILVDVWNHFHIITFHQR